MKTFGKFGLVGLVATVLALLTPNARAQMLEQKMTVTFSAPVEVPGTVLPAGSYVFQSLEAGRLTRILSGDEKHVYQTIFTIPDYRNEPVEKPTVQLGESAGRVPPRVEAWFFPGTSIGNDFIYDQSSSR
jgi:hypothetical protein